MKPVKFNKAFGRIDLVPQPLKLRGESIIKRLLSNEQKVLGKIGAYIRTVAKNSIKHGKAGQKSEQGGPPLSWRGVYKGLILFAYDSTRRSVVVGAKPISRMSAEQIPELLEYGGTRKVFDAKLNKFVIRTYRPRPALRLAFAKGIQQKVIQNALKELLK